MNSRNAGLAACEEVKRLYGILTMARSSAFSAAFVTDTLGRRSRLLRASARLGGDIHVGLVELAERIGQRFLSIKAEPRST